MSRLDTTKALGINKTTPDADGNQQLVVEEGSSILLNGGTILNYGETLGTNAIDDSISEATVSIRKTTVTLSAHAVTMTDAGAAGSQGSLELLDLPAGLIRIELTDVDLHLTAGVGGISDTAALVAGVGTAVVGVGNSTLTTTECDVLASTAVPLVAGTVHMQAVNAPTGGTVQGLTALTDNTVGVVSSTLAALPNPADTPATADALRDDLVANLIPVLRNAFASIASLLNNALGGLGTFDGRVTPKKLYLNLAVPNADSSANDTIAVTGTVTVYWRQL